MRDTGISTKKLISLYINYALFAAIVYCCFVFVFIYYQSYNQSWLLYLGNIFFGIAIAFSIYRYYKVSNYTLKLSRLIIAGQLTSIMGIIISCLICFLLLIILVPGFFMHANAENVLKNSPTQLQQGKNSYTLVIFLDAVFGNIGAGSFIAILLPFTLFRFKED